MKNIILSNGDMSLVDDEDFDLLNKWTWQKDAYGYARRNHHVGGSWRKNNVVQKNVLMHRVIINCPVGMQVDHINGNKLDNRRLNLRICTNIQNARNRAPYEKTSSKYKGVSFHKETKKWQAYIKVDKKLKYLGLFKTEEDAAEAYNLAAKENFGEFCRLNAIVRGEG